MISAFKELIEIITDRTKSFGIRASLFISIIAGVIIADLILGLSYNIQLNNKLNQLEKIQFLKKEYCNDQQKLSTVLRIENEIISREHYSDFLFKYFRITSEKPIIIDQIKSPIKTPSITIKNPMLSIFWMVVTSNYFLIILFPFFFFFPLYGKQKINSDTMIIWSSMIVVFSVFIFTTTWIAYQIPVILGKPYLNYVLNALIHTSFWILIYYIQTKNKKK
ncbi:MAG: hypothetical protein QM786_04570 [Breznakibacter sp.]